MRLYPKYDDIAMTGIGEITDDAWSRLKIAFRAENSQSVLLHRPQMRAARIQRHVQTGTRHAGSEVASYGPGSSDQEAHGLRLYKRLGNNAALYLAGCSSWNFFGDVDFFGALELRQTLFAEAQNVRFGCRVLQNHGGGYFLTPGGMRNAEAHRLDNRRMAQQNFVDLSRPDFFTAAIDEFLETTGQPEITALVQEALIARPKPSIGE